MSHDERADVRPCCVFAAEFWSRVDRSGPVVPGMNTPCWLWTGHRTKGGYGRIGQKLADGMTLSHRIAYSLAVGPVPDDMLVCHRCDNPSCVRPDHLFLGTIADNTRDMVAKGRSASGDRHGFRLRPETHARGERVATAKLTAAKVAEIRLLRQRGMSLRRIAAIFAVNNKTVHRICTGKAWRQ